MSFQPGHLKFLTQRSVPESPDENFDPRDVEKHEWHLSCHVTAQSLRGTREGVIVAALHDDTYTSGTAPYAKVLPVTLTARSGVVWTREDSPEWSPPFIHTGRIGNGSGYKTRLCAVYSLIASSRSDGSSAVTNVPQLSEGDDEKDEKDSSQQTQTEDTSYEAQG